MLKRQAPEVPEIARATPRASAGDHPRSEMPSGLSERDWMELLLAAGAFMLLMPLLKAVEAVSNLKRLRGNRQG